MSDETLTVFESIIAALCGTRPKDWLIAFGFAIVTIVPMVAVYYPLFNEIRTVYENGYYATLTFAFVGSVLVYDWYISTVMRVEL